MIKQIFGKLPRKPSSKSSSSINNSSESNSSVNSPQLNSTSYGISVNNGNSKGDYSSNLVDYSASSFRSSKGIGSDGGFYGRGQALPAAAMNSFAVYDLLPSFRDVPSSERQNLLVRKLSMCCVVFDFCDPSKNVREKELKRQTLLEIVDYLSSVNSKFNEATMQEIAKMAAVNLFRALPASTRDMSNLPADVYDPEDEEPSMEPSWPHLQVVYELLLRFVASSETEAKIAKRYIDHSFVLRLLQLFDSEDQREREYLKTILHRIYGKFMVHRPFIRKAINNIFYQFVFETEKHNGIAELLEILGSIVNGFALPLKEEHKLFLVRALIPLHRPKGVSMYHQQLSYCITQFVEKDFKLADTVIRGLLKYWPLTNSSKEVMFIGELEEVLEATQAAEFQRCMVPLFHRIGSCLNSSHFQVAERALFLWNNDDIRYLITQHRHVILPIIFPYLEKNIHGHWNQAVQSLALNVRKIFSDADQALFDECLAQFEEDELKEKEIQGKRESIWKRLEDVASSKSVMNEAVLVSRFPVALAISTNLRPTVAS